MAPLLGVIQVPTTKQSTCGTETILECRRLKSTLEAITPKARTTTTTTLLLTITPFTGHLHLYRTTPNPPKTQGLQVAPWILLYSIRLGHLTAGVPLLRKVGERYPAPTQNQRALGGNLHLLQSLWTMERLPGESLLGAAVAGETATQGWHLHLAKLLPNLCKMDGEEEETR